MFVLMLEREWIPVIVIVWPRIVLAFLGSSAHPINVDLCSFRGSDLGKLARQLLHSSHAVFVSVL